MTKESAGTVCCKELSGSVTWSQAESL